MENDKVNIDNLYQDRHKQFATLPATAWNAVEKRLDTAKPRKTFPYLWLWFTLLFFLLLTVAYLFLNSHPNNRRSSPRPIKTSNKSSAGNQTSETDQTSYRVVNGGSDYKLTTSNPFDTPAPDINRHSLSEGITSTKMSMSNRNDTTFHESPTNKSDQNTETVAQQKEHELAKVKNRPLYNNKNNISPLVVFPSGPLIVNDNVVNKGELILNRIGDLDPGKKLNIQPQQLKAISSGNVTENSLKTFTTKDVIDSTALSKKPSEKPLLIKSPAIDPRKNASEENIDPIASKGSKNKDTSTIIVTNTLSPEQNKDKDTATQKGGYTKHFDLGFKLGYETGFKTAAINKFIAGPYVQYYVSDRLSIMLQPAIIYGQARNISVPGSESFYNPTGTTVDTQTVIHSGHPYLQYTYNHTYDSIWVNYNSNKTTLEVELPLILQYHLANGISFGAGMNVTAGKLISIEEQKQSVNLSQVAVFLVDHSGVHPPPDTSHSFHHSVMPYSTRSVLNPSPPASLRIGYLLGVYYTHRRWNWELTLRQNISGIKNINNQHIREAYSQPYIRLSLSYRLSK